MPDPVTPVVPATPAAPAAPITPAPVAPAKPSLVPPRAAARTRTGQFTAKKALGLEETPRKSAEAEVKKARERIRGATPVVEITEPIVPAVTPAPAAAAPVTPPITPAAPAAPAAPVKIKIGDKEYTEAELQEKLKAAEKPPETPAPVSATPAAPAARQPTAEEIEAQKQELAKCEQEFLNNTIASIDVPMTEAELETILEGGKQAVELWQAARKRDMANAVLMARKGVAEGLNPVMSRLFESLKPLVANHENIERYQVKQLFLTKHKDFVPHVAQAEQVADELVRRYPQQVLKMSHDQFTDEVARQTDVILTAEHKRWFPQGNGNWRTSAQTVPVTPPAPVVPAVPPVVPVAVAPAAAPAARPARAPVGNPPSGAPMATSADWKKTVASSLRG